MPSLGARILAMKFKAVEIATGTFLLKEGQRTVATLLVESERADEFLKLLKVKEVIATRK